MLRNILTLGVLLCAAYSAFAATDGEVYIVNTLSRDISVIDTLTDTVTATIPLPAPGYRIAFSPRGDKAYVTAAPGVMVMDEKIKADDAAAQSQLVIVDTAKRTVETSIRLPMSAMANVHVHPNGRTVFVVTAAEPGRRNEERGRVIFLDVPDRRIIREVPVGLNPLDSVMTPDGSKLFVANYFSRDIAVVNLTEGRLQDNIPLGASPVRAVAMRPDGKKVYVVEDRASAVNVLEQRAFDVARRAQKQSAEKGERPPPEDNVLWEIDTATHQVARFPFDGLSPVYALALSPDGKRLYAHGRSAATVQHYISAQIAMRTQAGGFGGGGAAEGAPPAPGGRTTKGDAPAQAQQRGSRDETSGAIALAQRAPPAAEPTELVVLDVSTKRIVQRLPNLPLSTMTFSPDGRKLYLIGTPGDPMAEAEANRLAYTQQQVERPRATLPNTPKAGRAGETISAPPSEVHDLVEALRHLPKTVTVVDTQTGKVLKTLTVGSLPQGAGVLKRKK